MKQEMVSALRKIFWKERVDQMKTLDLYLNEQLKNEEFRKEWEENQPEMDIIRAMADARISQNLTQKELAERTGINQADISKLENGTRNPSLKLLKRLADGMGMDLKLVFTPAPRPVCWRCWAKKKIKLYGRCPFSDGRRPFCIPGFRSPSSVLALG